ncbi:MAG: alcohol dehydrogenase [Verrucomicrobiales bacterium]|nr:alcohol dehydrogenase [Verrucomicrobiales bacterium]|tara:strand:- start:1888 stop:3111 length:1224 start_codon:yes stop_codon:yes gene_type:complete
MKPTLLLLALAFTLHAEDWPQFLGPRRDGSYAGTGLAARWPADGPKILWRKNVGTGWSGATVAEGKAILFHRSGNDEIVECVSAASGKVLWKHSYGSDYRDQFGKDNGPRSTPAIADGRVYTMGAGGVVTALDFKTGKALWRVDTARQFRASIGFFGLACSPLVHGKNLLLNIGGENNAGIVAFDTRSGKLRWKTSTDNTSYSSPMIAKLDGQNRALFFTRAGLEAVAPDTGKTIFKFPWRPAIQASVNAATPLVSGNWVFISTSYGKGAAVLATKDDATETVWARDGVMSNQYATCVLQDGHLYGFHGRADVGGCELRCVELKTGTVKWSQPGLQSGTVTLAKEDLLVLTERGELLRAPANPAGFRPTGRAQILGFNTRAYPALANGLLIARDKNQFICADLRQAE